MKTTKDTQKSTFAPVSAAATSTTTIWAEFEPALPDNCGWILKDKNEELVSYGYVGDGEKTRLEVAIPSSVSGPCKLLVGSQDASTVVRSEVIESDGGLVIIANVEISIYDPNQVENALSVKTEAS